MSRLRPHQHGTREKGIALRSSTKEIHLPTQTVGSASMAKGLLSLPARALRAGYSRLSGFLHRLRPEVNSVQDLTPSYGPEMCMAT